MTEVQIKFERRQKQSRPTLAVEIFRVARDVWPIFRRYHYMSADLVSQANCFVASVGDDIAAFIAMIHFPHPKPSACGYRVHRLVTLPDWQGVGLGMLLLDTIASAFAAKVPNVRMPAAHPALTRMLDRSTNWRLTRMPGTIRGVNRTSNGVARMGGRACATFRYCGPAMDAATSRRLIASTISTDGSTNPSAPRHSIGSANKTGLAR